MKRIVSFVLSALIIFMYSPCVFAITETTAQKNTPNPQAQAEAQKQQQLAQMMKNAKPIELAFVFDGPSDKNQEVLKTFQSVIIKSLLPDYRAEFPKDLIFTGDWTQQGAKAASDKALASRARMVISLGYMSSVYYSDKKDKKKYVVTIDQYGLRDFGDKFFNPMQQIANDFSTFKVLVPNIQKTAILMNETYYKTNQNWSSNISKKLKDKKCDLDFVVIPVSKDINASLARIPSDVDSVFVTPLFHLTSEQRKELYQHLTDQKLPTFSAVGKEDVNLGAMLGTSTMDVDKKLAEATSFNIYGVLHGNVVKNEKIPYYDDKVLFYNSDTAEAVGYTAPLRLLNNSVTISHKELPVYDLALLINTLDNNNLDIARKKFLISAARRSVASAYMRYLPTLRLDLGWQKYNSSYARSYADVPEHVGVFTVGMDQVLYSPDLVSNILIKHKKLKFDKAEHTMTKANTEYQVANLYIETLMLENMIKVQEEFVQETRENLAIARVREKTGKCGYEEVFRWAGQVSEEEKNLLEMKADYKNILLQINKLLFQDQKQEFKFKPLMASDPAFFTSDLNIIDHVRDPKKLGLFTDLLVKEAVYLSPETTKLKAAIAMKKVEMGNYAQKFFLPNAKLTLEHTTQFNRKLPYENEGHNQIKYVAGAWGGASTGSTAAANYMYNTSPYLNLDKNSTRLMLMAEWKPIEGGYKIAEIARCKAELNELKAYLDEVNTEIEMKVRSVVNNAISKYFMIEKSYKAMFAQAENYNTVKSKYLLGTVPINQLADAQNLYMSAKVDALNSQYEFFKELIWVQRALLSVNWANAPEKTKEWIKKVPEILPAEEDFTLSL